MDPELVLSPSIRPDDMPRHRVPCHVRCSSTTRHSPDLSTLRVRFRVAILSAPPAIAEAASSPGRTTLRRGCSLMPLNAGEMPIPKESVLDPCPHFLHIEDTESPDMN